MPHNVNHLKLAYTRAEAEIDAKLGYSNLFAMPLAFKAIDDASNAAPKASNADIVNAAFHGRLRATILKHLRSITS